MKIISVPLFFLCSIVTAKSQNVFPATGNVGIGTSAPAVALDVKKIFSASGSWNNAVGITTTQNIATAGNVNSLTLNTNITHTSGNVPLAMGIPAICNYSGSGTVGSIRPVESVTSITGSGAITDIASFWGAIVNSGTAPVTKGYGLYLSPLPANVVNKYGVYVDDPLAGNYFAGSIGIGTTGNTYKLDVNGSVRAGGFTSADANETAKFVWSKDAANNWDEQLIKVASTYGPWGRPGYAIHTHETKHFGIYSTNWNALFDVEGGTGRTYIKGKVLIGKTSSNTGTNYMLDVNGNVRANKVVVNTSGADFVFEPGYALPSLQDVESFIQKNHHLPDIISAKKMKNDGVDIGEYQTKLLQKIEELTLYIISQDKKGEEQQRTIERQNNRIDMLNSKICQQKSVKETIVKSDNPWEGYAELLSKVEYLRTGLISLEKQNKSLEENNRKLVERIKKLEKK